MCCPYCRSVHSRYFLTKNAYEHRQCLSCSSLFISPQPAINTLRRYYQHTFDYSDGQKNEQILRARSRVILQKLRTLYPTARSLCDIGCGFGYFLDEARQAGYTVAGQEPSRRLSLYARRTFHIPVTQQSIALFSKQNAGMFDVVTAIHVIEHVFTPHRFVQNLSKLCAPGGIIYIETPNANSRLLQHQKQHYSFIIPPVHLHLPSPESLLHLLPTNHIPAHLSTYSYPEQAMGYLKSFFKRGNENTRSSVKTETTHRHVQSTVHRSAFVSLRKHLTYFALDQVLARLFLPLLDRGDKGCVLAFYIKKIEQKGVV